VIRARRSIGRECSVTVMAATEMGMVCSCQ
jgi:hypothetical protein